jgi:hypothetical protein
MFGACRTLVAVLDVAMDVRVEKLAEVLIWGADEHVMYAAAIAWWIFRRLRPVPPWVL